jgi:hypothetical protein
MSRGFTRRQLLGILGGAFGLIGCTTKKASAKPVPQRSFRYRLRAADGHVTTYVYDARNRLICQYF